MVHLRASEVRQLLHNKFVVVLGDSIQRAVYKDLVLLLQKDCLLSPRQLKSKGELSFERDVLLEGGRWGRMHNGTHYREVRQFCSGHHLVRFYFLTRAYSRYTHEVLEELRRGPHAPDVVVMNSCLWDLSRYGRNFRRRYSEDLDSLFRRLGQVLPESGLLVWNTAMPVAEIVSGGFLRPARRACPAHLREDVMEANFYSSVAAARHGFDVLDLHFHFRHAGQHRQRDGVHWDERAHRHLTQLLLAHMADAWGVALPGRERVGRWIRDASASRRPGPTGRRHPRDSRGDPRERTLSWQSRTGRCHRSPRRSSVPFHQPRVPFQPHHHHNHHRHHHHHHHPRDARLPSGPSLQRQSYFGDSSRRRVQYTREANSTSVLEPRLGPIRRDSTRHRERGSPPYPLRRPSEPHRRHQRCAHRRMHDRRETRP